MKMNKNLLVILVITIIGILIYFYLTYQTKSNFDINKLKKLNINEQDFVLLSKKSTNGLKIRYMIDKSSTPKLIAIVNQDYELYSKDLTIEQVQSTVELFSQNNITRIYNIINKNLVLLDIIKLDKDSNNNELVELVVMEPNLRIVKLSLKLDLTGRKLLEGFADDCYKFSDLVISGERLGEKEINGNKYITYQEKDHENNDRIITIKTDGVCVNIVNNQKINSDPSFIPIPKMTVEETVDTKNILSINLINYPEKDLNTKQNFDIGYQILNKNMDKFKDLVIVGIKSMLTKNIIQRKEQYVQPSKIHYMEIITLDANNYQIVIDGNIEIMESVSETNLSELL
jgi:hypothetical protein